MYGYRMFENGAVNRYGNFDVEDPALYQTDVLREKAVASIEGTAAGHAALPLADVRRAARRVGRPGLDDRAVHPRRRRATSGASATCALPALGARRARRPRQAALRAQLHRASTRDGDARIRADFRSRRESLIAVDEAVEAVVGALARTGRLDSTYILFTSDNGFFQGEHNIAKGKYLAYDPSSHVPLLIRGPGIPAGTVSGELVANADLAPTILEAAGATADRPVDGRSMLPVRPRPAPAHAPAGPARGARGRRHRPRRRARAAARVREYHAIRTARYLYVEWINGARELYDRRARPGRDALAPPRPPLPPHPALPAPRARAPAELHGRRLPPAGRPARRLNRNPRPDICWRSFRHAATRSPGRPRAAALIALAAAALASRPYAQLRGPISAYPSPGTISASPRRRSRCAARRPAGSAAIRVTGAQERPPQRPAARALGRQGRELRARAQAASRGSGSPCGPICRSAGRATAISRSAPRACPSG